MARFITRQPDTQSDKPDESPFPRRPEDIYRARRWLQHASTHSLPDELLRLILYYADYDCLHFSASSTPGVQRTHSLATLVEAFIETRPLKFLAPSRTSAEYVGRTTGRIRSVRLQTTGKYHDQNGALNSSSSWLELGKRRQGESEVQSGPRWAWIDDEWEVHELIYNDGDRDANAKVGVWLDQLEDGDRVSILPNALFGLWDCIVMDGLIDIEIQIWG